MKVNKNIFKNTKDLVLVALIIANGVILSAFWQIPIFSNIKIDLSYIFIIWACWLYGGFIGGFTGFTIVTIESTLFTSLGFSISWSIANLILGLICGFIFTITKKYNKNKLLVNIINILTIIIATAISMIIIKTVIECNLYNIPFKIKIIKNSVAFIVDSIVCLTGYFILLIIIKRYYKNKEVKNE